jgi:hypothetical protein
LIIGASSAFLRVTSSPALCTTASLANRQQVRPIPEMSPLHKAIMVTSEMPASKGPPKFGAVPITSRRPPTYQVRHDAVHLLVGFEHEPKSAGRWNFTRWDLVDLAHFKVRLKAEFQGSNRDIYRPEAILATSAK